MGEKHHEAPRKAMEGQGRTGNTREKTKEYQVTGEDQGRLSED